VSTDENDMLPYGSYDETFTTLAISSQPLYSFHDILYDKKKKKTEKEENIGRLIYSGKVVKYTYY
jgi:hypothetical protein